MFLKYLEPIFKPWRMMRSSIQSVRTVKGNVIAENNRVARFGNMAQSQVGKAHAQLQQAQGKAPQVQGQVPQLQPGQVAPMPGQGGQMQGQMPGYMPPPQHMPNAQMSGQPGQAPGMPMPGPPVPGMPMPGQINPNPPVKTVGIFRRRKICTQCNTVLDKTWDSCPYCAQAAAPHQPEARKTKAFRVDVASGVSVQILGWLVPIEGPQRGELYTLAPCSIIGTDPVSCQIVLTDGYMSSKHAEIRAEGGNWILRDLGSTNGTYVNDRRVDQHDLVDNDFIKFGKSLLKFKSL